jgi:hypothetical protein
MDTPNPQTINEDIRRRPVALCTKCGAYRYSVEAINQPCRRKLVNSGSGKARPCGGCFGSALHEADWEVCPACSGSGKETEYIGANAGNECMGCRGSGWIFVRTGG